MFSDHPRRSLPLPRGWPRHVKSAVLHAVALASAALTFAPSNLRSPATRRAAPALGGLHHRYFRAA